MASSTSAIDGPVFNQQDRVLADRVRLWIPIHFGILLAAYVFAYSVDGPTSEALWPLAVFVPVGIMGAIVANATGTGGGVVFVPIFSAIMTGGIVVPATVVNPETFTTANIVAISFAIQCFGMSIGSLAWAKAFFVTRAVKWDELMAPHVLMTLTVTPLVTGVPALLAVQALVSVSGDDLLTGFKIFSMILGSVLLIFTWSQRRAPKSKRRLFAERRDIWTLLILGALGGAVTALFSVGIGEFIAVYLILRKFPTTAAIAVAVWVSLVCIFAGVWHNISQDLVVWPIALMAIFGAVIGGFVAKRIAGWLGTLWLKTLAAVWIIGSSLFLILRAA